MTKLLLRLFVKDYQNTESPQVRTAIGAMAGFVGIGCNLLLFGIKLLVGILAGSVSITADALNNLSDASGSIVTLIGFRVAGKPADEHHPYGHARAEYLSALGVAALIFFIGFELVKSSARKILMPEPLEFSLLTAAVLLVSIGIKLWMSLFNRKLGNYISSSTLMATSADSRNDCIATTAVLTAALVEQFLGLRWTAGSVWVWRPSFYGVAGIWQGIPYPPCWGKVRIPCFGKKLWITLPHSPRFWVIMI